MYFWLDRRLGSLFSFALVALTDKISQDWSQVANRCSRMAKACSPFPSAFILWAFILLASSATLAALPYGNLWYRSVNYSITTSSHILLLIIVSFKCAQDTNFPIVHFVGWWLDCFQITTSGCSQLFLDTSVRRFYNWIAINLAHFRWWSQRIAMPMMRSLRLLRHGRHYFLQ